ncbi:MAG: Type 1 glutamine amidotransferase-like domain-containing protein [Oryzihumus sp.]
MSVFLVGGAFDTGTAPALLAPFLNEAHERAGGRPRVAVLLLDRDGSMARYLPSYVEGLGDTEVLAVPLLLGEQLSSAVLAEVAAADGLLVGGGWTPGYHQVLSGATDVLRPLVADGTPYAGFSAGAMVGGETALLGGYLSGGREVCEDGCSEDLDDLTLLPGLGLVPFTCDVHVTGGGTLGRAVELVGAGHVPHAVGIDEDTCLTVPFGRPAEEGAVTGPGSVWLIDAGDPGQAVVRRVPAS